jgi:hypothetical protein
MSAVNDVVVMRAELNRTRAALARKEAELEAAKRELAELKAVHELRGRSDRAKCAAALTEEDLEDVVDDAEAMDSPRSRHLRWL